MFREIAEIYLHYPKAFDLYLSKYCETMFCHSVCAYILSCQHCLRGLVKPHLSGFLLMWVTISEIWLNHPVMKKGKFPYLLLGFVLAIWVGIMVAPTPRVIISLCNIWMLAAVVKPLSMRGMWALNTSTFCYTLRLFSLIHNLYMSNIFPPVCRCYFKWCDTLMVHLVYFVVWI